MNRTVQAAVVLVLGGMLAIGGVGVPAHAEEATPTDPAATASQVPEPKAGARSGAAVEPAAATTMSITLDHAKVYPRDPAALTANIDAPTNPDGGSVLIVVNGLTRSAVVADNRARISLPPLPIGSYVIRAGFRAAGETQDSATASATITVISGRRATIGIKFGQERLLRPRREVLVARSGSQHLESAARRPRGHSLLLCRLAMDQSCPGDEQQQRQLRLCHAPFGNEEFQGPIRNGFIAKSHGYADHGDAHSCATGGRARLHPRRALDRVCDRGFHDLSQVYQGNARADRITHVAGAW